MTTVAILLAVAVVLMVLALVFDKLAARRRSVIARTVIVQTVDGQSIRGVLVAHHVDRLTLEQASAVEPGGAEVAIAGRAHVPAANVAWIQELPR